MKFFLVGNVRAVRKKNIQLPVVVIVKDGNPRPWSREHVFAVFQNCPVKMRSDGTQSECWPGLISQIPWAAMQLPQPAERNSKVLPRCRTRGGEKPWRRHHSTATGIHKSRANPSRFHLNLACNGCSSCVLRLVWPSHRHLPTLLLGPGMTARVVTKNHNPDLNPSPLWTDRT